MDLAHSNQHTRATISFEQLLDRWKDPAKRAADKQKMQDYAAKRHQEKLAGTAEKEQRWLSYQAERKAQAETEAENAAIWARAMDKERERVRRLRIAAGFPAEDPPVEQMEQYTQQELRDFWASLTPARPISRGVIEPQGPRNPNTSKSWHERDFNIDEKPDEPPDDLVPKPPETDPGHDQPSECCAAIWMRRRRQSG